MDYEHLITSAQSSNWESAEREREREKASENSLKVLKKSSATVLPDKTKVQVLILSSCSHGIFPSPLPCSFTIFLSVCLIYTSYIWHQGIIRIRISKQGTYWQKNCNENRTCLSMIGNNCMCHGQNWWIGKLLPQQKGNSNKQVLKSFLKVLQPFHEPFESNKHLKIVTAILQMKHLYADFSRQERRYMSDLCDCYMHNISSSWIESAFDYCCASETYFRILNSFCEVSLLHQDFASLIYTEIIIVSKSLRNVTDHGGNQTPVPSQSWFRKQRLCMSCKNCHHK